ncbi:hypothetical protein [Streptomyces alboflavus]|uniref:hypothetical protein n=1 Tax=Streptomyces alboflavus TaxID=67267 RepID=UPI000ADFFFC4|nr:hypothetical protein [Streptomyces alboflavus]
MIYLVHAAGLTAFATAAILTAAAPTTRYRPVLIVRTAAVVLAIACLLTACVLNAVNP